MKTRVYLLLAFLFGLFMNVHAADNVNGNGTLSTRSIKIDDFNEVRINGLMDFNYEQSNDAGSLDITLDENLHQYINIDIHDRILTLSFDKKIKVGKLTKFIVKSNSKWLKKAKIAGNANFMVNSKLTGDELEIKANDNCLIQFKKTVEVGEINLDVSGSANMVIEELKADKLNCNMGGSGSIRLKNGSAKQGNFTTLSSGDIHAFGVSVSDAKCKMAGSGLTEIHPTGNLSATLIGKGNIRYKGPATVQERIIGKGKIEEVK